MPRKKSSSRSKRLDEVVGSSSPQQSKSVSQEGSSSKGRGSRKRYVDTEEWVSKHLTELINRLGLDFLELSEDEYLELLTEIVDELRGDTATLNIDTIVRKFKRTIDIMYSRIAGWLLRHREKLSIQQLEFVINYIGSIVLGEGVASRLYREAIEIGRHDLVERLRYLWRMWWVKIRYPILPMPCPICGFYSIMPDLTCLICGNTVSEKQLKEYINFSKLLEEFAKSSDIESIKKAISYGYVYVNSLGVKAPSENRDILDVEILLTDNEKELLKKYLSK